jgi:hypothetical protein
MAIEYKNRELKELYKIKKYCKELKDLKIFPINNIQSKELVYVKHH